MKKILLVGLALTGAVVLASCNTVRTPDADISGTWDVTLKNPEQPESSLDMRYVLTQAGQQVSGVASVMVASDLTSPKEYVPFGTVSGTVIGDKISLVTAVTWEDVPLNSIELTGKVDDQKMNGSFKLVVPEDATGTGNLEGTFTADKIK